MLTIGGKEWGVREEWGGGKGRGYGQMPVQCTKPLGLRNSVWDSQYHHHPSTFEFDIHSSSCLLFLISLSGFINLFSVESPSGRVTLQRAGLDFEQYTNFTVTVNSTDSGFPPYTVTDSFEISVTNANEMPQRILLDNNQVNIVNAI